MLWENAYRLLLKHADGGRVERIGQHQLRATVNGRRVDVVAWSGRVGAVVVQTVKEGVGGGEAFESLYSGPSLRDGLRAALRRHRLAHVDLGGPTCDLLVEIGRLGTALTPDLSFMVNKVLVSTLQDTGAFALAEAFIETGEGRPLLDYLMENSPDVAAEVERCKAEGQKGGE